MSNFVIRAAETWTPGNIAGGIVLAVVVIVLLVRLILVSLRR